MAQEPGMSKSRLIVRLSLSSRKSKLTVPILTAGKHNTLFRVVINTYWLAFLAWGW